MVSYIVLNKRKIDVERYREEDVQGLKQIVADFKVTSEDYHDIATLLYQENSMWKYLNRGLLLKGRSGNTPLPLRICMKKAGSATTI